MMEKMDGMSKNLLEENVETIKHIFPSIVSDGKIDFDSLKELLGAEIDSSKERYQFLWNGKGEAIKIAQSPSSSTLRPVQTKSKKWNETNNLYIEGDNLEVLKQLQKTYFGRIKAIYIDPPYNTGNDFVYDDDFSNSVENYKDQTNQLSSSNPETSGRFHSNWLNMMYPRLILARNLLSDDGVIFISMDDNEIGNLKKICDEIFGENNFAAQFLWTKTSTPPALSYKCRTTVEYVLCYEKRLSKLKYYGSPLENGDAPLLNTGNPSKTLCFPKGKVKFSFLADGKIPSGQYEKVDVLDEIIVANGINENEFRLTGEFKWVQETLDEEVSVGTTFVIKSDKMSIRFQRVFDENNYKTPNNNLNLELGKEVGIGTNESAVKELEALQLGKLFDFPKPVSLIKYLFNMVTKNDKNAYVMDFFSGSGTAAQAVMQLNAEDGGNRKYILVQLPEKLSEDSNAFREGFKNICDIGEERIRRAGKAIEDSGMLSANVDTGFKVFSLDSTNINPWDNTNEYDESSLFNTASVFKIDRSNEDVLYEIMLKYGVFDQQVSEIEINGKTMYRVGQRHMIVCLENKIDDSDITEICKLEPRVVVFKEDGFKDDNAKINAEYNLKKAGVEDVKAI